MTSTQRFQSQREQLIAGLRLAAWTHFGPWALHCAGTYTRHSFGFAHSFRQKTIKLGTCHRITSGIIDTSWLILNTHRQNHIVVLKTRNDTYKKETNTVKYDITDAFSQKLGQ